MNIEDTLASLLAQQELSNKLQEQTNGLLQTLIEKAPSRRKSPAKAKVETSEQVEAPLEDTFSSEKYIAHITSLIESGYIQREEVLEAKNREKIDRLSSITTLELASNFNAALRKVIVDRRGSEISLQQLSELFLP